MAPNIKHARPNDQDDDQRLRIEAAAEKTDIFASAPSTAPPNKTNKKDNQNSSVVARTSSSSPSLLQENRSPQERPGRRLRRQRKEVSATYCGNHRGGGSIQHFIPPNLEPYIFPYHGDFCVSTIFNGHLIAQVMAEGFLPIAAQGFYLLPKLHQERCVIDLPNGLHVSKSIRKKAKKYAFTVNQAMSAVVQGCLQQHGSHCWLYPPLVRAFDEIHQHGVRGQPVQVQNMSTEKSATTTTTPCRVRLYSIEVWEESAGPTVAEANGDTTTQQQQHRRRLVAGELGYTVGSIYTSLTGFSGQDSAGSIQLASLGQLLCQHGFALWDLGMDMAYKRTLGSRLMSREDFVQFVHQVRCRDQTTTLPVWDHASSPNCRDIIDNTYAH